MAKIFVIFLALLSLIDNEELSLITNTSCKNKSGAVWSGPTVRLTLNIDGPDGAGCFVRCELEADQIADLERLFIRQGGGGESHDFTLILRHRDQAAIIDSSRLQFCFHYKNKYNCTIVFM